MHRTLAVLVLSLAAACGPSPPGAVHGGRRRVLASAGLTNRQDTTNPFRKAHFVYVPYCTGDLHVGDAARNYDSLNPQRQLHPRGASNMDAFLLRLKATFPDAEQLWLMGSSAGGYGAQLSFDRVSLAFSGARVDLLR